MIEERDLLEIGLSDDKKGGEEQIAEKRIAEKEQSGWETRDTHR